MLHLAAGGGPHLLPQRDCLQQVSLGVGMFTPYVQYGPQRQQRDSDEGVVPGRRAPCGRLVPPR